MTPDNVENGTFGNMDIWRQNNVEAQAMFHMAMFNWLQDDKNVPGTCLEHSLHEWKVVLALYTSALERQPIDIESFVPDPNLFHELSQMLKA